MKTTLDQMVLIYFAVCGLSRLARYNITAESLATSSGAVKYFEGTPIPTSLIPLGVLVAAFANGNLYPVTLVGITFHALVVLFLLSGSLMISKTIRIPKP
jgi:CDP-diacylglycerol--serine O-phosphatidyltransferase